MRDRREYRTTALRCKVARARAATLTQSVPFRRKYFLGLVSVTSALLLHSRAHCVNIQKRDEARRDNKLGGGPYGSSQPRRRKVPTPPRADRLRAMRQQPVHAGMVGIGR